MGNSCDNQGNDSPLLVDRYNRVFNYMRVSVTDRCNFRCGYCVSHTPSPILHHREILSYEEILKIVKAGIGLGISKVRVTGGEPLVRRGIYDFLSKLSDLDGLSDLSLTTNGMFLKDNLPQIKAAGIKRLNISLDSLKKDRFHRITGQDGFHRVWDAILSAHDQGFSPIKINMVALRGINDDEISDFAALTYAYPFHIRFIEYMPIGTPELTISHDLLTPEIKQHISALGKLIPVDPGSDDGPARRFRLSGALGEIGFISPVSNHFCQTCNRIRLTANGQLRPCLLSDETIDVAGPLRSGCSDKVLCDLFRAAAHKKHEKHRIGNGDKDKVMTRMASIGG